MDVSNEKEEGVCCVKEFLQHKGLKEHAGFRKEKNVAILCDILAFFAFNIPITNASLQAVPRIIALFLFTFAN